MLVAGGAIGALLAGGGAFAAATINGASITNRTIAGIKLKSSTITSTELKNAGVKGADLASGAVTGAKIADGSVTAADLAPGTIPSASTSTSAAWERTLPSGSLLTGVVRTSNWAATAGDTSVAIADSFDYGGHVMPSGMTPNVVLEGGASTTQCPGTAAAPDAAPGQICLYVVARQGIGGINMLDPGVSDNTGRFYRADTGAYIDTNGGKVGTTGMSFVASAFTGAYGNNIHQLAAVWAARAA